MGLLHVSESHDPVFSRPRGGLGSSRLGRPSPGSAGVSPASGPHDKAPWFQPKSSAMKWLSNFRLRALVHNFARYCGVDWWAHYALSPYQLYSLGRLGKGAYCLTGNRADGPCRNLPNRSMLGTVCPCTFAQPTGW